MITPSTNPTADEKESMQSIRTNDPPKLRRVPVAHAGSVYLALLGLLTVGCRASSATPQGVAEHFVDQHYVRMDLNAAQEYCVGVAWQKVEEEKRLIGDQQIDASTRKPRVTYRLKNEVPPQGDSLSFLYEGTIQVDGADEFTRQWLVSTRKEPSGLWKVSNFSEFDAVAHPNAE
jgi:hypothetical protein